MCQNSKYENQTQKENENENAQIFYGSKTKQNDTEAIPDHANNKQFRELLVDKFKREIKTGNYRFDKKKVTDALKRAIKDCKDLEFD